MNKLPVLSGKDVIKILIKVGFYPHHQKGSHIILKQNNYPLRRVSVPNHATIKRGLLLSIIEQAGLTKDEFLKLMEE